MIVQSHRVTLVQAVTVDLTVRVSGIYINGSRVTDEWFQLFALCTAQGCTSGESTHDVTLMMTEDLECYAVPTEYAQRAIDAYMKAPIPERIAP